MANSLDNWPGPRCKVCDSPVDVGFIDGSGIQGMWRRCPVCDNKKPLGIRVYCAVTVEALNFMDAEQKAADALAAIGKGVTAEAVR